MISGVFRSIIIGIFFTTYSDLVDRYDFYKKVEYCAIISLVANVNEFDSRGMQPIQFAVGRGNFGATLTLIEKFGSNINERTLPVKVRKGPNGIPPLLFHSL